MLRGHFLPIALGRLQGRRGNAPALPLQPGVRYRHGRKETAGIGMQWTGKKLLRGRQLQQLSQVQNPDAVAEVSHHRQVMGDKQHRQVQFVLQIFQQIDDLCLDGYVQCGNWLVGDQQPRLHHQRPGNADTLPLTTGKLVGIPLGISIKK